MKSKVFSCMFILVFASCKTANKTSLAEAGLGPSGCSSHPESCAKIPKIFWSIPQNLTEFSGLPRAIRDIYEDGGTVYVATNQGLAIAREGITKWKTRTMANGLGDNLVNQVAASGSSIYATHSVGMSVSRDGGESWTWLSGSNGFSFKECGGLHADPPKIYVACRDSVYISRDDGRSWEKDSRSKGLTLFGLADIAVEKTRLYAAGSEGLFQSTNDGASWEKVKTLSLDSIRQVQVDGPRVYVVSTSGDLFLSLDEAASWTQAKFNDGRVISDAKDISATEGRLLLGTLGDGLFSSSDGGRTWSKPLDPPIPNSSRRSIFKVFAKGTSHYMSRGDGLESYTSGDDVWRKVSYDSGLLASPLTDVHADGGLIAVAAPEGIHLSNDEGRTWNYNPVNAEGRRSVIAAVKVLGQTIYAAGKGLFMSKDAGKSWESLSSPTEKPFVNSIFIQQSKVYTATEAGVGIWSEGKQEFKSGTGSTALADLMVNDVYVDESGRIFAANRGGLSISRDGGNTWTTPLKASPVSRAFFAVAGFQNRIFAGGESDLFVSEDGGETWTDAGFGGMTAASTIYDIHVDANFVWLSTQKGLVVSVDQGRSWISAADVKGVKSKSVSRIHAQGALIMIMSGQQLLLGNSTLNLR